MDQRGCDGTPERGSSNRTRNGSHRSSFPAQHKARARLDFPLRVPRSRHRRRQTSLYISLPQCSQKGQNSNHPDATSLSPPPIHHPIRPPIRPLPLSTFLVITAHTPKTIPWLPLPRRPSRRQIIQLALIEIRRLHIPPHAILLHHPRIAAAENPQALVPGSPPAIPPDVPAPSEGQDDHDDEGDFAGAIVRRPPLRIEFLFRDLLGGCAVGVAAYAGLEALFAIDPRVTGRTADGADVDVEEAVEHVAGAARVVEGNHMACVVEEDVGEVARFLVEAGRLAFKGPVAPGGNRSRGDFKSLAPIPFHVVNERLGAEVVADEVFLAREEEDGDFAEEVWEESDGRWGVAGTKSTADGTIAFRPAGTLVGVDVESVDDIFPTEVGGDVFEVRGPVHAAAWVLVIEADVVHVHTALVLDSQAEDILQDGFAVGVVDMGVFAVAFEVADALCLGGFDLLRDGGILDDHTGFVGIFEVGI